MRRCSCHDLRLLPILITQGWKSNFTVCSVFFKSVRLVEKSKLAVILLADCVCVCVWWYMCVHVSVLCVRCLGVTSWAECEESAPALSVKVHPAPFFMANLTWPRCAFSPGGAASEPEASGLLGWPGQPVLLYKLTSQAFLLLLSKQPCNEALMSLSLQLSLNLTWETQRWTGEKSGWGGETGWRWLEIK